MANRAESASGADGLWTASGLDDMRRQAVREIAVVFLGVGIALIPLLPLILRSISGPAVALVFALIVVAGATFLSVDQTPRFGAYLLVGGFFGILGIGLIALGPVVVLPWFVVAVLISGLLIGPLAGAILALAGSIVLLVAPMPFGGEARPLIRGSLIALLWVGDGLSWLALRPLLVALGWSWQNYLDVRKANQALQERQGELNRTLKSLGDALYRLDQANHELERARKAANEARQLKSEFAVNVSHELRTPLNLIIGFSEMMVTAPQTYEGQDLPPAYREDAIAIYRNARHLSDLVDDILDLSQIEAGRMALQREFISIEQTIVEAIDTVAVLYTQKGLEIETDLPPELPPVFADRTRVRQTLINLLSNAARFTDRGGATTRVTLDESDFIISVADTGEGIAAEDLPRVFSEFWQANDPRHRQGGSGVGLTVSKRFVEMHGGTMVVASAPGRGTTFTFTIPRSSTLPEMPPFRPWETWVRIRQNGQERPAIALVTEEEDILRLFERYFDDYTLIPFGDVTGLPGLAARANLSGVVVVAPDSYLAHRRAMAARTCVYGVPILACGMMNGRRSLADRLGIADYLTKPIDRGRLGEILHRLGGRARKILVVDDDPDAARLVARMIRSVSRRYRVSTATSGAEALRILGDDPPDALFLDLVMPEIDGYTLIESIHGDPKLAGLGVVAVSARDLSAHPLSSDGLILLEPDGIAVSHLMECLRHALKTLSRSGLERPEGRAG